jgi:hypothetical protein
MDIAIKSTSARDKFGFFRIPGLGDRIHILTCAWAIFLNYNERVTVHLSGEKYSEFKEKSLNEIKSLFPKGILDFRFHNYYPETELEWKKYIYRNVPGVKFFYYGDHRGPFESKEEIDISPLLKNFSRLQISRSFTPKLRYPSRFITTQWDSTADSRSLPINKRELILEKYREQGYKIIYVGGEATEFHLRESLSEIAFAISESDFYVGVDSAFFHLAQLYLPVCKIHLYNDRSNYWSHHLLRFIDNGGRINQFYTKIRPKDWFMIKLRNDSPLVKKFLFSIPGTRSLLKLMIGN